MDIYSVFAIIHFFGLVLKIFETDETRMRTVVADRLSK